MEGFKRITLDVMVLSGETRDLGKLSLQVGTLSEAIVTEAGTSQLKGSGWYNARRDNWNANEYFRKKQGAEKPFFEVNISGYSIGGPVVIPKLLGNGSEKRLFFFVSQEFVDDIR